MHTSTDKQVRLVHFDEHFIEADWCAKGHTGYVLEGEMKVEFENETIPYSSGDGLLIEDGLKHKAIIEKGKFVALLLFENKCTHEL